MQRIVMKSSEADNFSHYPLLTHKKKKKKMYLSWISAKGLKHPPSWNQTSRTESGGFSAGLKFPAALSLSAKPEGPVKEILTQR